MTDLESAHSRIAILEHELKDALDTLSNIPTDTIAQAIAHSKAGGDFHTDKPCFIEDMQSAHRDPLAPPDTVEPDYDRGEVDLSESDRGLLGVALNRIFQWVVGGVKARKADSFLASESHCRPDSLDKAILDIEKAIARRFISLAWVVSPQIFDGASLAELSRRLGISKPVLSIPAAEFSRAFGITNRSQAHGHGGGHAERLKVA